jgi:hypothetical protein
VPARAGLDERCPEVGRREVADLLHDLRDGKLAGFQVADEAADRGLRARWGPEVEELVAQALSRGQRVADPGLRPGRRG